MHRIIGTERLYNSAPAFETYHSLLDRHPLLRAHRQDATSLIPLAAATRSPNAFSTNVDLKPLKQAAIMQHLSDNEGRICQYDLFGECRDKGCKNLHLTRLLAVEPSGMFFSTESPGADVFIAPLFHLTYPPCRRHELRRGHCTVSVFRHTRWPTIRFRNVLESP